ncbi:hypothetical protein VTJ49DRAFT_6401 [Mycothermus thermophilus]|uniref:Uncharacterized protein n=1 Tax=Humicola insolens TaxID=85995 RepID=A0ABR3VQG4_HUMIN
MLRLDRDQECYDFIKWWAHVPGSYDFGDASRPYLDTRDADVFEPLSVVLTRFQSLSHLVSLTLLKLRLYHDLKAVLGMSDQGVRDWLNTTKKQYHELIEAVHKANPHFWEVFVDDGSDGLPEIYGLGSKEEALLVKEWCTKSWQESGNAYAIIEADTTHLVSVYQGTSTPSPTAAPTTGRPTPIVALCVDYPELVNDVYKGIISRITSKVQMDQATTPEKALELLGKTPRPPVILVADSHIGRNNKVLESVADCLYAGSTVILCGCFSTMISEGQFTRMFTRLGLPWRRGSYTRETTKLWPGPRSALAGLGRCKPFLICARPRSREEYGQAKV